MKTVKEFIITAIDGFFMALADSVPGVSGGTIAFLLGFYDQFIGSLDKLFTGSFKDKKEAFIWLIKLGIGWGIGFILAATVLSSLFTKHIYAMSSLFLGFIIVAIPIIIKEELASIKGHYKNIIFAIIGILLVVGITILNNVGGLNIDVNSLNLLTILYVFIAAAIAISAMVLPGMSGSTLLLVFGLYIPIMTNIKKFLTFDFSAFPILFVFGLGVLFGIVFFVRLIKRNLDKHRSPMIYLIIGLMLGSLYSIVMGPTTLEEPLTMMNFKTFNILFFVIGIAIIGSLELLKKKLEEK